MNRKASSAPKVYDMTLDEAAAYLRRNRAFVYRAVSRREIAHTKSGRELRFSRQDLANYLESRRVEAVAQ